MTIPEVMGKCFFSPRTCTNASFPPLFAPVFAGAAAVIVAIVSFP